MRRDQGPGECAGVPARAQGLFLSHLHEEGRAAPPGAGAEPRSEPYWRGGPLPAPWPDASCPPRGQEPEAPPRSWPRASHSQRPRTAEHHQRAGRSPCGEPSSCPARESPSRRRGREPCRQQPFLGQQGQLRAKPMGPSRSHLESSPGSACASAGADGASSAGGASLSAISIQPPAVSALSRSDGWCSCRMPLQASVAQTTSARGVLAVLGVCAVCVSGRLSWSGRDLRRPAAPQRRPRTRPRSARPRRSPPTEKPVDTPGRMRTEVD